MDIAGLPSSLRKIIGAYNWYRRGSTANDGYECSTFCSEYEILHFCIQGSHNSHRYRDRAWESHLLYKDLGGNAEVDCTSRSTTHKSDLLNIFARMTISAMLMLCPGVQDQG